MKLNFKEDPKEWRKNILLTALGLAILTSILRWRQHLTTDYWVAILVTLALLAFTAIIRPPWFRGWYRLSLRLGFYSSRFVGYCALVVFFIFVLIPLGWWFRLIGKDSLQLKRPRGAATYWTPADNRSSLDQLF